MERALYGPSGFFTTPGGGPAAHFRTSVHASPLFTGALLRLLTWLDQALGAPPRLDVVDVGAGRGELLCALAEAAPAQLRDRLRLVAVERAARPPGLPAWLGWRADLPGPVTGLLVATEWLDNVPLDVASADGAGVARYVLVDPASGAEKLGGQVSGVDARWLARWWPLPSEPGARAEIGAPRDAAWASAVAAVRRGLALCVDYGHMVDRRPVFGTLTGFRAGRQVAPVPDGSCDLTAHVAVDALARPGSLLLAQRDALRALGVHGQRPPLDLARHDPAGYLRALAAASAAAELTDLAGLGGHYWLAQPVGVVPPDAWQDVARCRA
ncbi:MAG TPA: SAM-dependent methyltransferase [Micromonosporaceae bacterium]|nr:SAM-dependent methyltransferase [Micromonosporaceae bacterium]